MKYLFLVALALTSMGCVTPSRFDSMGLSLGRQITSSVTAVLDSQEGKISIEEARGMLKNAAKGIVDTTKAEGDSLEDTIETLANLAIMLAKGTPAAAAGVVGLNMWRNRNRRKRGELVSIEAAEKKVNE